MDPRLEGSEESNPLSTSSAFHISSSRAGFAESRGSEDSDSTVGRWSTHELRLEPFDNFSYESQTQKMPQSNARESSETPGEVLKREPPWRPLRFEKDFRRAANE
jgi:hypothetical protein